MHCRRAVTAVVAVLLGSTLLSPAARATPAGEAGGEYPERSASSPDAPPARDPWPGPKICTEAGFTSHDVRPSGEETGISLTGWIRPCPGVEDPGVGRSFTLYYGDRGYASRYRWPIFDPYSQSYTFDVGGYRNSAPTAICVIDALYGGAGTAWPRKRACIGIDRSDTGLVVTPIPIDDPRVGFKVQLPMGTPPAPFCAGCL